MTDDTFVLVPREPTIEMMQAGYRAWLDADKTQVYGEAIADRAYRAMLAAAPQAQGSERELLQEGRDHLTITGKFQSDKYPWCHAGFVPLKTTDPMARDLLSMYAERRASIDKEFCRDLTEALFGPVDETHQHSRSVASEREKALEAALHVVRHYVLNSHCRAEAGAEWKAKTLARIDAALALLSPEPDRGT